MVKRIFSLAVLALVLAVPAALAGTGQPQAGPRAANVQQRLEQMRHRLQNAAAVFAKHCAGVGSTEPARSAGAGLAGAGAGTGRSDTARCTTAAKRMLDRLQKIDRRIGTLVGKIEQRCGGGTTAQAVPKACARVVQVEQPLQDVQARVQQFEQKLQSWLGGQATATGSSSSAPPADDSGLESLDQLSADLAAVQSQSGN